MQFIIGNQKLIEDPTAYLDDDEVDYSLNDVDEPRKRYMAGEWKAILQLMAVLQYGKLAKLITDRAIDACEHLQNLRVAIFDYKLRIDALEVGSKRFKDMFEIGVNYLVRYFYLITFADYLLEIWAQNEDEAQGQNRINFSEWLKDRREILNIIKHQSLD